VAVEAPAILFIVVKNDLLVRNLQGATGSIHGDRRIVALRAGEGTIRERRRRNFQLRSGNLAHRGGLARQVLLMRCEVTGTKNRGDQHKREREFQGNLLRRRSGSWNNCPTYLGTCLLS
jgi:hypothetical protein